MLVFHEQGLKGTVHPKKIKFCHHLLIIEILKNWSPLTTTVLFGYTHSSVYLLLCSTEETYTGLEQHEGEYMILEWTVPLNG